MGIFRNMGNAIAHFSARRRAKNDARAVVPRSGSSELSLGYSIVIPTGPLAPEPPSPPRPLIRPHHQHELVFPCEYSAIDKVLVRVLSQGVAYTDRDMSEIVQTIELAEAARAEREAYMRRAGELDGEEVVPIALPTAGDDGDLGIKEKYQAQVDEAKAMAALGWELDTTLVYLKIARRGYEPIFPITWKIDFPKFPGLLFTPDYAAAFFDNHSQSEFRMKKAFDHLCMMGQAVRAAELRHSYPARRPEAVVRRHLRTYQHWIWADRGLTRDIVHGRIANLIAVEAGREGGSPAARLEGKVRARLRKRAVFMLDALRVKRDDGVEEYLEDPPTLFGFVVVKGVVGVVALEPLDKTGALRTIGFFHLNRREDEIWNCISLAIIIMWVGVNLSKVKAAMDRLPLSERPTPLPLPLHSSDIF
jgi:hypothetical protein